MAPLPLFLEELEAGTWAGQEHPEALCGESRTAELPRLSIAPGSSPPDPAARNSSVSQVLTFLSEAGTKLRNSSTWPTANQSTKSSTGGCTLCAWRKSRTTWVTLRPLDLGPKELKKVA